MTNNEGKGSSQSTSPPLLIPNLPDDIAIQCIARVPRSYHFQISIVSKSWHSLFRSPHFFSLRTHLKTTQNILYINVRIPNSPSKFKWFLLDPTSKNLSPIPQTPFQAIGSAYAVIGPKFFVIGGSINDIPKSNVWVFDCRFNKWEIGPKMRVGREFAAAGVVNGKIYVLGGCLADSWATSTHWAEVFDPVIGSWAAVPSPLQGREKWMHASAVIGEKIYAMADRGGVVFDPHVDDVEEAWGCVSTEVDLGWRGRAAVVDEILFCYDYLGKIRGFDVEECVWKELRGLDKVLPKFLCGATMANIGDKLCVVWEGKGSTGKQMEVSCAEIVIRKDSSAELWGSIVWSQVILTIPRGSSIIHCLAVSL